MELTFKILMTLAAIPLIPILIILAWAFGPLTWPWAVPMIIVAIFD